METDLEREVDSLLSATLELKIELDSKIPHLLAGQKVVRTD